jgi:hypothetical protein
MPGGGRPVIPVDEVARVDQDAAALAQLVAAARRHMQTCPSRPAGICIGAGATNVIAHMDAGQLGNLLQEAIAQLARAAGGGERP